MADVQQVEQRIVWADRVDEVPLETLAVPLHRVGQGHLRMRPARPTQVTCRHVGGEHRLRSLNLAHGSVRVLEAGPIAKVSEATDTRGDFPNTSSTRFEGNPFLGNEAIRTHLDNRRRLPVAQGVLTRRAPHHRN